MDDHQLLRDYVERQSEAAFAELVARHVNLVYGTAKRVLGDDAAAQDVVQAVFIHLARKAWTVRDGRALPGWLYRAAYRTALDAIRGEQRRRQRETAAMKLAEINASDDATWEKLAPLLDEAMQHLNRAEQDAVLFRFFEGKSIRETGAALGTTEAAAQMRVGRALEKMRAHFARGGVTVAAGALALVLSARPSEAAPVGLAARVTGPALAGAEGAGAISILARILFMSTKTKILIASVVIALVIAFLAIKLRQPQAAETLPTLSSNLNAAKATANLSPNKTPEVELPVVPAVHAKGSLSDPATPASSTSAVPTTEPAKIYAATLFVNSQIDTPLLAFKVNFGTFPTTEEGLLALIYNPNLGTDDKSWHGPYLTTDDVPLDPWGHPYQYAYPSSHGQKSGKYDVWSMGPDGISGTADDICNWGEGSGDSAIQKAKATLDK